MKVCKVKEIRDLDRRAIEEFAVPAAILMENAGQAVAHVIKQEIGTEGRRIAVLCGPGNNGGDGFVVARHLQAGGAKVKVLVLAARDKYRGEARQNLDIIAHFPVELIYVSSKAQIKRELSDAEVIVDAMLGTGLDRNVEGLLKDAIELINSSGKKVFAIDIPSGVNGDTGQVMGVAVKADYTITFGLPKVGNLLYLGFGLGGKLYVAAISYPRTLADSDSLKIEVPAPTKLLERQADTNKMSYGPVLVVAGAANYFWAPHASAYSFLKAGGGYVFLACPKSLCASVGRKSPEVVMQPQVETSTGSIALANKKKILEQSKRVRLVVLGPGLSLNEETQQLARELAGEIDKPLLIDGDGLTAIAGEPEIIKQRKAPTILTPHVGEMSRITGRSHEEIEANRVEILQQTAAKLNAHIVLKGPHSLVGFPDGSVFINMSGTTGGEAGMATAGSGDVLNGTIAAIYCLGLEIPEAVRTGVFVHGLAGDMAAFKRGPDGMTAKDILNTLPQAVRYYREFPDDLSVDYYDTIHSAD